MYLTDKDLRARLDEFGFQSESLAEPFSPEHQIGPCSVDLRLSNTYWTSRPARVPPYSRPRTVDLERSRLMELSPTRGWRRHDLSERDKITIAPGEMVLCRTAERFQMPSDCAGMIEARSSYARLGLAVSIGGFINPGWRGYMPLTLINHSNVTLRIPVGTPLCQLLVVKLADDPEADYASRSDRKYVNDSGSPSLWWRDAVMSKIRSHLSAGSIDSRVFEELEELFETTPDEPVIGRLEDFIGRQSRHSYGNADDLLSGFARTEKRRSLVFKLARAVGWALWTVALGGLITVLVASIWVGWIVLMVVVTVGSIGAAVWAAVTEVPYYLTPAKLDELVRHRDQRRSSAQPRVHS